jgi:hypothetical protein
MENLLGAIAESCQKIQEITNLNLAENPKRAESFQTFSKG